MYNKCKRQYAGDQQKISFTAEMVPDLLNFTIVPTFTPLVNLLGIAGLLSNFRLYIVVQI